MKKSTQLAEKKLQQAVPGAGVGVLVEADGVGEEEDPYLGVAEDAQLLGLLEQPALPFGEGHLPARRVLDPLNHRLPPHHHAQY